MSVKLQMISDSAPSKLMRLGGEENVEE